MKQRYSRSAEADAYQALYKLPLWRHPTRALRAQQLAKQPLCERHQKRGEIVADTVNHSHRPCRRHAELCHTPLPVETVRAPGGSKPIRVVGAPSFPSARVVKPGNRVTGNSAPWPN